MINTKDVFHTPRQQAHCTRAIHIESDPALGDRLHGGFGANLERFSCKPCRSFEVLRTIVLPERPDLFFL